MTAKAETVRRKPAKSEKCPTCNKTMNVCTEERDLHYCPECSIYVRDGQIVTSDINGTWQPTLGHVKPELTLVSESHPQPQNIDIYFNSGDKKCFRGVTGWYPRQGWIILTKPGGKEISINANNVNLIEEL